MGLEAGNKIFTSEEYLVIERKAEYRSEYLEGEMVAMAGASKKHNLIVANLIRVLGNQLLERNCSVFPSDMRVKIEALGNYVYPDIVVACSDEEFEDNENDTLLNPVVIIEVLSDKTEAYDRGKKFEFYQTIPSLVEYILVSQKSYRIEQFIRQNERIWTYADFHRVNEKMSLSSIQCELMVQDVYAKVTVEN